MVFQLINTCFCSARALELSRAGSSQTRARRQNAEVSQDVIFLGKLHGIHCVFWFDFSFVYMFTAAFLFMCLYFEIKVESFKVATG